MAIAAIFIMVITLALLDGEPEGLSPGMRVYMRWVVIVVPTLVGCSLIRSVLGMCWHVEGAYRRAAKPLPWRKRPLTCKIGIHGQQYERKSNRCLYGVHIYACPKCGISWEKHTPTACGAD